MMYCCWGAWERNETQKSLTVWGRVSSETTWKSTKRVRELLKHVSRLCTCRQEQNRTHMISINTYHIACAKGSAFMQCYSFFYESCTVHYQIWTRETSCIAILNCIKNTILLSVYTTWFLFDPFTISCLNSTKFIITNLGVSCAKGLVL